VNSTRVSSRICVFGSLNADHRVRVDRLPGAGETVLGSDVVIAAGGKGANQAVAAARAGGAASIVGAIGDDSDGRLVRQALVERCVDVQGVQVSPGATTGRAMITVDAHGENTIVVSPGANTLLTADDMDAAVADLQAGDLVLLQLETPERLVRHAARAAKAAGCDVVLNAAPVPETVSGLFENVDLLVVNEHELAGIAAELGGGVMSLDSLQQKMVFVAGQAGATVICTAGSDGAYVTDGDVVEHVRAPTVTAVDTTAAGDTFIGYLAASLAADRHGWLVAIERAVQAAAITVTRAGAIDSIPYRHDVDETHIRKERT
jgi:ribokinase